MDDFANQTSRYGMGFPAKKQPKETRMNHTISLFGDIDDEYDPEKPNDYEVVTKEKELKKQLAVMEAERQELLRLQKLEEKVWAPAYGDLY